MMLALILLSLVAVTYEARQSCDGNCRIPPPEQLQTTSRPYYCKCLEKYIEWLNANKLQEKVNKKQKNSLNYEPAENGFHHQNIKVGYPLFSNSVPNRTPYYYKSQMPHNISPSWALQYNTFKVPESNIPSVSAKIKRKNHDRDITVKTNYSPLYLDINIKQEAEDGQATHFVTDVFETKRKELTERNFKDCLDLHAIIFSRDSTGVIVESMLSERNKIYNKLPNSDILIEIKKKCSQSANIIAEGMNEINNKRPFKKSDALTRSIEYSFNSYGRNGLQDEIKEFKYTKTIDTTERNIRFIEHSTPVIYSKEDYNMERYTTEFTKDISSTTIGNNSDILFLTSFDNPIDLVTDIGEESTTLGYSLQNIPLGVEHENNYLLTTQNADLSISTYTTVSPINDDENITADSTVFTEDSSTEHMLKLYYEEVTDEIIDTVSEQISDNLQNNEISTENYFQIKLTGVNRPSYLEGEFAILKLATTEFSNATIKSELEGNEQIPNLDFIKTSDDILQNDEISTENDVQIKLTVVNRPSYLEGEYAILKLVTTEYSNETIKSEHEGNEQIPNLDFIKTSDDTSIPEGKSDTVKKTLGLWEVSNENSINYPMQNENFSVSEKRKDSNKNSTEVSNLDINGEIFFKYGPDYVPATFVQKPDGQVNLALNLISLCKQNKKEKSKLIQAICNCITQK